MPNDPIVQWEITVDTGVEDDLGDTERRIFVDPRKGRRKTVLEGRRGGDAVAVALKKARAHRVGLEIGGTFFLTAGEKVQDGDGPETATWTAEYQPPAGGPGSGTPVDEMPWLVGGGRYDKAAELAKWERRSLPALRETLAGAAAGHAEPRARVSAAGGRSTSAVGAAAASHGVRDTAVALDDQPPF
jgi:hypothetical protein